MPCLVLPCNVANFDGFSGGSPSSLQYIENVLHFIRPNHNTSLFLRDIVLFKMDISVLLNPGDLFSASGLVVVLTGGGSGITMLYS